MKLQYRIILIIFLLVSIFGIFTLVESTKLPEEKRAKFDLRDKIDIKIEYQIQATYTSCFAYAALDMLETNIMLHQNIAYDFSEAHVNYMTSKALGGVRSFEEGGTAELVLKYIADGFGPVLESEFPNRTYQEEEYHRFSLVEPMIKSVNKVSFDQNEEGFREKVKRYLVNEGSLYASLFFVPNDIYYDQNTYAYANLKIKEGNHAVSIIGWDDHYSKYNFPKENRPKNNGAYIVMSFFKKFGNDHIMYVSYEDVVIESEMVGISDLVLN